MKAVLRLFCFFYCLNWILGDSNVFSQSTVPAVGERLRLAQEADSLVIVTEGGQEVWEIWGNVHLVQGKASLRCDWARWRQRDDHILLVGNVKIDDGGRILSADRVDYDGKTRTERAAGNVSLTSGSRHLTCRRLDYFQERGTASAFEDVVLTDFLEKATLHGEEAFYDREADYARIVGIPRLVKVDSASGERMVVDGLKMEIWGDAQRILLTDSVRIEKGDLKATCRTAEYRAADSLLVLYEKPVVWYREQVMRGDTIGVRLDGIQFTGSTLWGHAQIISADSTLRDELKGRRILIEAYYTEQDTIRKIFVEGQASSLYHVDIEEENERGVNAVTGDRIIITIRGDQFERVEVESSPGQCTGMYTPVQERARELKGKKDS
jgi:lipopolysaccharide export system protein LptA